MVFFCCVRAFPWIDYRIIEFIRHLSFCKKRDFYDGDSEKKWGMLFLFSFFSFCGGTRKNKYIFYKKNEEIKKEKRKKSGNWDLISFPHCSYFIAFTDVYTHFQFKLSTL